MTNIIEDLSALTTIPECSLKKLSDKVNWCICNAMQEAIIQREATAQIDLDFGMLVLSIENDEIHYKFIPKSNLEEALKETINSGENPLINTAEKCLVNKIIRTYKDFI